MEKEELKKKIKDVIVNHQSSMGLGLSPDHVMSQLKPIWIKLEEAGLVQPGMSFQGFVEQANHKAIEMQMRDFFNL